MRDVSDRREREREAYLPPVSAARSGPCHHQPVIGEASVVVPFIPLDLVHAAIESSPTSPWWRRDKGALVVPETREINSHREKRERRGLKAQVWFW